MKVLVAEDDLVSRKVLVKSLKGLGYEVIPAVNGREAWEHLDSDESASLAIIDWMMPEMDGVEVIKKLRSTAKENYTFVILLTGKSETEDVVKGIDAGADDYLTKPFNHAELHARLRAGERIVQLEKKLLEVNSELASANIRMKMDLEAVANIQKTLLPNTVPKLSNVNVEWLYKPCDELAGDILNVFMLDERHMALYLLDVSGHGVGAALLSVTLSRILSPHVDKSSLLFNKVEGNEGYQITRPVEVVKKLNSRFSMDDESGQYFTLVYGVLDTKTLEYTFIAAGHPNSVLMREGKAITFDNSGLPVGFFEEAQYKEERVQRAGQAAQQKNPETFRTKAKNFQKHGVGFQQRACKVCRGYGLQRDTCGRC